MMVWTKTSGAGMGILELRSETADEAAGLSRMIPFDGFTLTKPRFDDDHLVFEVVPDRDFQGDLDTQGATLDVNAVDIDDLRTLCAENSIPYVPTENKPALIRKLTAKGIAFAATSSA